MRTAPRPSAPGLVLTALLLFLSACAPRETLRPDTPTPAPSRPPLRVLCLASSDLSDQGLDHLDPEAVAAYRSAGIELDFGYYQDIAPELLRNYPVVIGMMPMLHAGTRALDERRGAVLSAYLREGGGFLLMPTPSYYGAEDFVRQLNPWLEPLGARLLNEQPRDPAHQRSIHRVLGYRYLDTRQLATHPVTRGVDHLWLPLDYTDAFLSTHTMALSPAWNVLVRGEASCATFPFLELRAGRSTPGTYTSAPPFLAVREVGRGRMALFSTSSQYFLFDAYHWAFGDGMVMKEGGLRLMTQLIDYLANGHQTAAAPPKPAGHPEGNVPVMPEKQAWLEEVLQRRVPPGFQVAAYIDCGSVGDLPWTAERGWGYADANSWLIRWSWSEVFHATAANSRAFDLHPLLYRFSGLAPAQRHALGILLWTYQPEGARDVQVRCGDQVLGRDLAVPRYDLRQCPRFQVLELPAGAVRSDGTLDISFSCGAGGSGSFSSVAELWLFSPDRGESYSPSSLQARFESPSQTHRELPFTPRRFAGMIGAQSTLSGGTATVAELCAAARGARVDFLAFTEDSVRLGPQGLGALQAACAAESSASFRALPGVSFTGRYGREAPHRPDAPFGWGEVTGYTFHPLVRLPDPADYDNAYTLFWRFFGGELAGGRSAAPTFHRPLGSAIPPWFTRFWRGFDAVTLDAQGHIAEDARPLWTDLLASGYGPHPRVFAELRTPDAVRAAAASGWTTAIYAPDLASIEPYHYTSCIGNGPVFRQVSFSFDHARSVGTGEGLLFLDQALLLVRAQVAATSKLARVTLYSGTEPVRVWYPRAPTFEVEEPVAVARNHEFWLQAEAEDGTEARTGRMLAEETRFMTAMCGDNQNSICNLARPATRFLRDERELFLAHSYWHTGEALGQLGALRDARRLVPRVIETGIIQPVKRFLPAPVLRFADGATEDHLFSKMRIAGASRDVSVVDYTFDAPGARASSVVRLTSFRPSFEGDTAVLVESVLTAQADLHFAPTGGLQTLELAMLPDLAPNRRYTWQDPSGTLHDGAFSYGGAPQTIRGTMGADGGALLWPSEVGSLAVLPLDGQAHDLAFRRLATSNAREAMTFFSSPTALARGSSLTNTFLVLLHQGLVDTPAALRSLRAEQGGLRRHVLQLDSGSVQDDVYVLRFRPRDGRVAGRFQTRGRRDPLPVLVEDLQPAWSCVVAIDGQPRLAETLGSRLYVTLPPGLVSARVALGHPLRADRPDLRIEWAGAHAGGVRFHVHNPAPTSVVVRIWSDPLLAGLRLDGTWALGPGESAWLWGRDALLVQENSGTQIAGSQRRREELELHWTGGGALLFSGATAPALQAAPDPQRPVLQAAAAGPGPRQALLTLQPVKD